MFSQISWQQYFAYVAVTGLLYYIIVVALYYRNQLFRVRLSFGRNNEKQPKTLQASNAGQDIMGKAFDFNSPTSVASIDLQFSDTDLETDPEDTLMQDDLQDSKEEALRDSEGFISDFKNNLTILKEADGTRDEFISLFISTASKYPGLNNASQLQTLNLLIAELISDQELGFVITSQELGQFWHESFQIASSVNQ